MELEQRLRWPVGAPAGTGFAPELVEQAKRRSFTAAYNARIVAEADACTRPGEVGELLRREGLCTSHLTYWRTQRGDGPEGVGQGARAQAGRQARSGDRSAEAQAGALQGGAGEGASGGRD